MKKVITNKLLNLTVALAMTLVSICAHAQQLDDIKNQTPVRISGNLSIVNTFYQAWGIENRRPPYYWLINGNVNISIYGVNIPISASVSQQQSQFVQPFNQYGLSPKYKSITLHAGYRSMLFSELTLGSNVFLGGGLEYAPSNLPIKVSVMRGRLIAPTPPGTYRKGVELPPTYSRMGQGVKVTGYRKSDQFDLTLFQAKDDPESIKMESGTINAILPTPEENFVIELGLRKRLAKQLTLDIKYAQSLYNIDSRSPAVESENSINKLFKPVIGTNASTQNNKAIIGKLNYSQEKYNLYLNYRRIDPEYKSMGSVFLANDIEDIAAGLNMSLLQNKINLDISGGVQYNNLKKDKVSQVKRLIGGLNLFYNISERSNLLINYSNFNASTVYSAFETLDSLNYVQVTQNAGVTLNHSLSNNLKGSFFIQGNLQQLTDSNDNNANFYNFSSGYQTKLSKVLSSNTAINYTNNNSGDLVINAVGPSFSISAKTKQKFRASLSVIWLYAYTDGNISNKYKTYSLNLNYPRGKHHRVSGRVSFLDRIRIAEQTNHLNELRAEISYGYTF